MSVDGRILVTLLEMLRDRKYNFDPRYHPDKLLKPLDEIEDLLNSGDLKKYQQRRQEFYEELSLLPMFSNKVDDTSSLPIDDKGTPVFILIQEGTRPLTEKKDDHISLAKKIVLHLKSSFPDLAGEKDLKEIAKTIHLIIVFNHIKYDNTKFETLSFPIYNLEYIPKYRLVANPIQHQKTPKHTLMTDEEAKAYKEKFQVVGATMQRISLDDPINRYYYGTPGQIYMVKRRPQGYNARIVIKKLLGSEKKKK
jgi:DNA-directed RNA polymerase subunit H (RpoH/RPB5)